MLTNPTYTGRELENKLTSIGYSKMMTESIPLNIALGRVMPSTDGGATYERVYIRSIFGAMAKHPFPVANLLSAARRANMYQPPAGDKHSLLMVPPGMLEIAHYTRPDSMQYSVSGFKQSEQKRMYLDMPGAFLEPQLGVKVVVCKRPPDYSHGMAHGRVLNEGHLNTIADWATVYEIPAAAGTEQYGIVDHEFGNIKPVADDTKYYRPSMRAMMGSALLVADPGPNTGEMLFAYPSTGIRTDQEKETMKCTLRVYLGAAIYREDCLLKLPHVSFEGIKSGGGGVNDLEEMRGTETLDRITNTIKLDDGSTAYEGAVWIQKAGGSAGWELYTKNSGHLGVLDDPDATDRLHGMHKFDTSSYKP